MTNHRKIQIARLVAAVVFIILVSINGISGFVLLFGYLFFGDKFINKKFFNEGKD